MFMGGVQYEDVETKQIQEVMETWITKHCKTQNEYNEEVQRKSQIVFDMNKEINTINMQRFVFVEKLSYLEKGLNK